jgi:hypothetical protein
LEESLESFLNEIKGRIVAIESSLPKHVDALAVSRTAKLPFKALLYREALIWRIAELGRSALQTFEHDELASAILLTRAAIETSAAVWYLCAKLDSALESGTLGDIDDYLMKLAMGSKTNPEMPQAINVLTFVDHVDKTIQGFRGRYDVLSEFAHPNWAGTTFLYSKSDPPNFCTDFGTTVRDVSGAKKSGVIGLSVALMIFERSYNRIGDSLPAFIMLCENALKGPAATT